MGFHTQKLRVATLFGLVMDHATPEGMEVFRFIASRARRPQPPKNSAGDDVPLEASFQSQCKQHGYQIGAFLRGREHNREVITQINLQPSEGSGIKLVETAKTEPKAGDPNRLKLQVRLQETISEAMIQELIDKPLTDLIMIEGPVGKILTSYRISRINCFRRPEGSTLIDAKLAEEENDAGHH